MALPSDDLEEDLQRSPKMRLALRVLDVAAVLWLIAAAVTGDGWFLLSGVVLVVVAAGIRLAARFVAHG